MLMLITDEVHVQARSVEASRVGVTLYFLHVISHTVLFGKKHLWSQKVLLREYFIHV